MGLGPVSVSHPSPSSWPGTGQILMSTAEAHTLVQSFITYERANSVVFSNMLEKLGFAQIHIAGK